MGGRQLASKWLKTEALLTDPEVAPYIPHTRGLSKGNLQEMLETYAFVVVKPIVGGGGYGVIKVTRYGSSYSITHSFKINHYTSFQDMYNALLRVKVKRKYLIQQGIHLARIQGRPIDYRVKYVKNGAQWEFRAMVGRLARSGLFVTNLSKGGYLLSCREGLRRSLPHISSAAKRKEMRHITRKCTSILENHFPGIGELGFDYGLDYSGRMWIFEVNTRPQ
ncbi:YheC/YheD family protein [Paenibacillus dokdonensis]|uniref:YheC/YheD family protein n=1 Tax=Paenibacillus dokdonensis TaxID=2567944 RepID=A0ABU6GSY6_9BACL|nr:YheC/YheD family protein [Paenibacillus dokdonensis]MEC0241795.1 YheC/YheD family protein [Paenibacillus dokdonensis]